MLKFKHFVLSVESPPGLGEQIGTSHTGLAKSFGNQDFPMVGYTSGEAAGPGPDGTVAPVGVTAETTPEFVVVAYVEWEFEQQQQDEDWRQKRVQKRYVPCDDDTYYGPPSHVDRSLWKRPKSRLGRNGIPKLRQEVKSRAFALRWRP
jgi:hypothetical protein